MLTTGESTIDGLFKSSQTIDSKHNIIAEWNHNSYVPVTHIGSYPIDIRADGNDPVYAESFNIDQVIGGWDNGGHFYTVNYYGKTNAVTGATYNIPSAGYVTYNSTGHTFEVGQLVQITGASIAGFNGTYQITGVGIDTFAVINYTTGSPTFTSGSAMVVTEPIEDDSRKKLTPIRDIILPERPDPGIVYPFITKSMQTRTLLEDSYDAKAYNILQASNRLYPVNESMGSKYWISSRYCKPNSVRNISWEYVGISDSNGTMKGNNVFTRYESDIRTNKIVVKTQTINGYARDFTIEVLLSGETSWTVAYQTTNSTAMKDGILRLTRKYVAGSWQWIVAAGVEEEGAITSLLKSNTSGYQSIKGIRFSVQELAGSDDLPKENGTLDVIELSPRMVIDLSGYTSSFNLDSSIGDNTLGLPVGSIVTGNGKIELFNEDNLISNKNVLSIVDGMLKPNVKITFLSEITHESTTKYIPLGVMYTDAWTENSDFIVSASLEDGSKFLRDKQSPDVLLGSVDGIKVSAIIKILLDNAGFTRYSFVKTAETEQYINEDTKVDFFWSKKEFTVMEILNNIAKSAQLSMFFDQYGYLVVMTKEAASQKNDQFDYMLVGDYKNINQITDPEYYTIYGEYISNISNFEDDIIPPITSGEVQYSTLGIPKTSLQILESAYKAGSDFDPRVNIAEESAKIIDSGYSEVSLNKNLVYAPQQIWSPTSQEKSQNDAILAAGVVIKDISLPRPIDVFPESVDGANKNDAIRAAYASLTESEKSGCQIVVAQNDLISYFSGKYNGYVYIDTELIKFNGIVYMVSRPGSSVEIKIYFSENELSSDVALYPSGSSFSPYALLVDIQLSSISDPNTFDETSEYSFSCVGDGRGFNNTKVSRHYCGSIEQNGWTSFSSKLFSAVSGQVQNYGQSLRIITDSKVPDLFDITKNISAYGGYAVLSGAPTNKESDSTNLSNEVQSSDINIKDVGQQFIFGFKKDAGFVPSRIGTRMNILQPKDSPQTISKIGGIAFNLSNDNAATTGYFLEVSTVSETAKPSDYKLDNVKLYKVYNSGGTIVPEVLKTAWYPGATIIAENERVIQNSEYLIDADEKTSGAVFSLEVAIADNRKDFTVYINGKQAITAHDPSPLTSTNNVAVFGRDDSNAVYDYFYAVATPNGVYPSVQETKSVDKEIYMNALSIGQNRGIFSPFIKNVISSSIPISYDDFGNTVREVKYIETRYNDPAFISKLLELSKVSPSYFIKDFRSTSWGASFWVYNASGKTVYLGSSGDNPFPISISGIILRKTGSGSISIGEYLESIDSDSLYNDKLEINRKLYGDQPLTISGEYINNYAEATRLAEWIAKHASTEKIEITASIFPNPLLQIGDKVKVFYKSRGYCNSAIGDKTYVLSQIGYNVDESGIEMNVRLREMV